MDRVWGALHTLTKEQRIGFTEWCYANCVMREIAATLYDLCDKAWMDRCLWCGDGNYRAVICAAHKAINKRYNPNPRTPEELVQKLCSMIKEKSNDRPLVQKGR
jgi:hypothetical protein